MPKRITEKEMQQLYTYYKQNICTNKQRTENYIIKELNEFIKVLLVKSHVYIKYWSDFKNIMIVEIFRAFDTYQPEKNVKLYGWCWKICSQCAWRYIKQKQKEFKNEGEMFNYNFNDYDIDEEAENINTTVYSIDENTPESEYIKNEEEENSKNILKYMVDAIICTPLEKECYCYRNGLFGFPLLSNEQTADAMNLNLKTVKNIVARNNKQINEFKKYLLVNRISTPSIRTINEYKKIKQYERS